MIYNGQNVVYFASPVFTCYNRYSLRVLRQMVDYGVRKLIVDKLIESNLPSTSEVTYRKNSKGQKVLTILHYVHQRRAKEIDIVEDVIPLRDVEISVLVKHECHKVVEHRTTQAINFTCTDKRINMLIPRIDGFAVISL